MVHLGATNVPVVYGRPLQCIQQHTQQSHPKNAVKDSALFVVHGHTVAILLLCRVNMQKDYNRVVCNTCACKERCVEIRSTFWCSTCTSSLTCAMKGSIHDKSCTEIRRLWRTLPRKCILTDEIMRNHLTHITSFRDNTHFCVNEYNMRLCPRCLQTSFVTSPYQSAQGRVESDNVPSPLYCGHCLVCAVYTIQHVTWT